MKKEKKEGRGVYPSTVHPVSAINTVLSEMSPVAVNAAVFNLVRAITREDLIIKSAHEAQSRLEKIASASHPKRYCEGLALLAMSQHLSNSKETPASLTDIGSNSQPAIGDQFRFADGTEGTITGVFKSLGTRVPTVCVVSPKYGTCNFAISTLESSDSIWRVTED